MKQSILVVGAGFAGACYARELADAGYQVDVIDRRNHIAGNTYDFVDENGIRRHRYGPHLFHTSSENVVQWLKNFCEWTPYEHRVRAQLACGQFVPLPINLDTINSIFGSNFVNEKEVKEYLHMIAVPISAPKNAAEHLYSKIGKQLTDTFFRHYTRKMWSLDLEEMHPSVVKRLPLRFDRDDRYFPNDAFQILPAKGYTDLFKTILNHKHISIQLETPFEHAMENKYLHIFNSMPIDEYFQFCYGDLPYRSVKFHHRTEHFDKSQSWATTNFTDDGPFTRETYWHLLPNHVIEDKGCRTVTAEEPCDYKDNNFERYYPVKTADSRYDIIYNQYCDKAREISKVSFIGRCGTYRYLDMHQVISQSLSGVKRWMTEQAAPAGKIN